MSLMKKGWINSEDELCTLQCCEQLADLHLNGELRRVAVGAGLECAEVRGEAAQRRREKRRKNKQKYKKKLRQVKQKAMIVFQNIIKEIYSLSANYQSVQKLLQECFLLEDNNQILYNQIDEIMRGEIDIIRKRIVGELNRYRGLDEVGRDKAIRNIFDCVFKIQKGSPEIQKIINLYVKRRFGDEEEETPLKTNLDLMTLKFLYINDLQPSEHFADIVCRINASQTYKKEREVYENMMSAALRIECSSHSSEWSGYQSQEEQYCYEVELDEPKEKEASRKKKRKERKRKVKIEVESSFESIMQRAEELQFIEDRLECKVQESWVERMRAKQKEYSRRIKEK